ncbi:hypothetical protein RFI_16240 [Reticulomyxa filosa]|uniref:Sulfotransferase domain-containing protein n=1 Tax=Reticulomyxa filosa TaxID=46433 RepID=X6N6P0_RETFI|nr:hypothetical protein RFI_16240 [Reticulomyxa filosa]|eukprot:ETO20962.1 hypothetical protein RFI_16240 [Reticulomyxa filosa]
MSSSKQQPFRVVCAGYGRTGTESMKMALDTLGLKCYHLMEFEKYVWDARFWTELLHDTTRGKEFNWSKIFDRRGYVACCDWPMATFYQSIIRFYNQKNAVNKHSKVKVILTKRNNPLQWYESVKKAVVPLVDAFDRFHYNYAMKYIFGIDLKNIIWKFCFEYNFPEISSLDMWKNVQNLRTEKKDHFQYICDVYERHEKEVTEFVDPEDLLIFETGKHGFKEICDFLQIPYPLDEKSNINRFQLQLNSNSSAKS